MGVCVVGTSHEYWWQVVPLHPPKPSAIGAPYAQLDLLSEVVKTKTWLGETGHPRRRFQTISQLSSKVFSRLR